MGLDTRFIEVKPTDTVEYVLNEIAKKEAEKDTVIVWLVVALEPPWQFATVRVTKLGEVDKADWDKPLKDTSIKDQWELGTVVPEEIVEKDYDLAVRMAHNNLPSEVLVVRSTVSVFTEEELPTCKTTCPHCDKKHKAAGNSAIVKCKRQSCGKQFRAVCGGVGAPL